jgi:phospholipid/cholesterol/gamma-HCH transport system substrate-binding protein
MENKAHALAAGTFVLIVSALLVGLAVWLTRDTGVQWMYEVSSPESVTGLQPQAAVRFRGVNVGKVDSISFDPQVQGHVLLRIKVDEAAPLTRSSFATLGFQGVTGIAFVQLDDSGESKERLTSRPDQITRIPMHPSLVSQVTDKGTQLLTQLDQVSQRLNQLVAPDNQKVLIGTLDALGQAAGSLPPLVQDARGVLKGLNEVTRSVAASGEEVKQTATEFRGLAQAVQQPGAVLDQLTQGAAALATAGQTLQAVQSDTLPRLNRSIDDAGQAARTLDRLVNTLSDNPRALIFGHAPAKPGPGEPGFVAPAEREP